MQDGASGAVGRTVLVDHCASALHCLCRCSARLPLSRSALRRHLICIALCRSVLQRFYRPLRLFTSFSRRGTEQRLRCGVPCLLLAVAAALSALPRLRLHLCYQGLRLCC